MIRCKGLTDTQDVGLRFQFNSEIDFLAKPLISKKEKESCTDLV